MTADFPRQGFGMDGTAQPTTDDPYEMWDAAYVLGSLSSNERREYETHLSVCKPCRMAVAELGGMPALLALLDRDEIAAAPETPAEPPPLRAEVLDALLEKVSWRRRRSRWVAATVTAAAAVVLALGVFVAVRPGAIDPTLVPRTTVSAMTMAPVASSELNASFTLTSHGWGTNIDMTCTYSASADTPDGHDEDAGDKLAMVAVGRDGKHVQLATWMAQAGVTAVTSASTSMPIDEIAAVQVVSADSGDVLLQRDL
jgi:Putative zinc-finger